MSTSILSARLIAQALIAGNSDEVVGSYYGGLITLRVVKTRSGALLLDQTGGNSCYDQSPARALEVMRDLISLLK